MKKRHIVLTSVILLTSTPLWAWEFNNDGDAEGWGARNVASLQVADGKLVATVAANTNDPFLPGPQGPWATSDITGVMLRAKVSTAVGDYSGGAGPALYFFNPGASHQSFLLPDPNQGFQTIWVNLMDNTNWTGRVNNVRVDLADRVPEDWTCEIDWIRYTGLYLDNESFELWDDANETYVGWRTIGGALSDLYDTNVNIWDDPDNTYSADWSVKHIGNGEYHALTQPITGGLDLEAGVPVTLHGALKVPTGALANGGSIWFRIREFDGTTEQLSPPIEVAVFDEWFEFESPLVLSYSAEERTGLDVQLYAKLDADQVFYFDNIFVDIGQLDFPGEDENWPYNQGHFEFNTPGDAEGWRPNGQPGQKFSFFDVNVVDINEGGVGALLLDFTAGTQDPFITGPGGPFYSNRITGIAARMRFSGTETDRARPQHWAYWFYAAGGNGRARYQVPVADEWFVGYLPCNWKDWISRFRLDFGHYADTSLMDIDWIRLYGHYLNNNGFSDTLDDWGGGSELITLSEEQASSAPTALKIEGKGRFHAAQQRLEKWDVIPQGAEVTVRGMYYIPSETWDPSGVIWLRVNEYDGNRENMGPAGAGAPAALDRWVPFEDTITTIYAPQDRRHLSVQLFSNAPAGTVVYVDDVFVDVVASEEKPPTWPVNSVRLSANQTIAIDGQVSAAEYAGAQALVLDATTLNIPDPYVDGAIHQGTVQVGSATHPVDDYSGTFYFMWDDTYLYAALSAQDDNYTFVGETPNKADCLQFVLGAVGEMTTANMLIPTIAPDDGFGNIVAKSDFWLKRDIFAAGSGTEYAAVVDPATQDWSVEVKIPWTALRGSFAGVNFPPAAGDSIGFSVVGIDYDDWSQDWLGCIGVVPWQGLGIQTMTFVE